MNNIIGGTDEALSTLATPRSACTTGKGTKISIILYLYFAPFPKIISIAIQHFVHTHKKNWEKPKEGDYENPNVP